MSGFDRQINGKGDTVADALLGAVEAIQEALDRIANELDAIADRMAEARSGDEPEDAA